MVEAVENLIGRVKGCKNDILSWTLCLLASVSSGASFANTIVYTRFLVDNKTVLVRENQSKSKLMEIDIEIERSATLSIGAIGISSVLFLMARRVDRMDEI